MKTRRKITPDNGTDTAEMVALLPGPPPADERSSSVAVAQPRTALPVDSPDGTGPTGGPPAWFPAALRTDRGRVREDNQDTLFGLAAWLPGATAG